MMNHTTDTGKFTIGADPELLLQKSGEYVAVQPYVQGTKEEPQPLPLGGNVQRDNVAIEFGVKPAANVFEFVTHIGQSISDVLDILPEDVSMHAIASADFHRKQLVHAECKEFGCNADWNAWTMEMNTAPRGVSKGTLRSCGGHIHVGYVPASGNKFLNEWEGKGLTIRVMDAIVGIPATALDDNEPSRNRRKLYGKAGCFRPTDYGVEYRTLSNFWIKSPLLVELMYNLTADTLAVMREFAGGEVIDVIGGGEVQRIMTEGDSEASRNIIGQFLKNVMSQDSYLLYQECLGRMDNFNFLEEWEKISCI